MSPAARSVTDDLSQPRFRSATAALARAAANSDGSAVIFAKLSIANSVYSRATSTAGRVIRGGGRLSPFVGLPGSLEEYRRCHYLPPAAGGDKGRRTKSAVGALADCVRYEAAQSTTWGTRVENKVEEVLHAQNGIVTNLIHQIGVPGQGFFSNYKEFYLGRRQSP